MPGIGLRVQARTAVVRSDDIRADPRYGQNAPYRGMPKGHLPVVSYLAVPVISRSGEVIGGQLFGHERPGVFSDEAEEIVTGIAAHAAIAIDNARLFAAAQEEAQHRELLLNEFKHRIKNTLATVQAIVAQTLPHAPAAERQALNARLDALAEAHDLLTEQSWDRAPVRKLVRRALAPFRRDVFAIDGPEVELNATRSLLLTMTLHELATNAAKYGALSDPRGRVHITWTLHDNGLAFRWQETGGPPVVAPLHRGFGSRLIEKASDGKAHLQFAPDGVVCTIEMPVEPMPGTGPAGAPLS